MPKVDPNNHQIHSDAPSQPDDLRGGKLEEDTLDTESEFSLKTPREHDYHSAVLPGEKKQRAVQLRTRPPAPRAAEGPSHQLTQQRITFKAADRLTDEEKASACVVANAGKALTTGKQAECYANDFIGLHVKATADGQTYAELGVPLSALREQLAAAQKANSPALASLQKQLADVTAQQETLFKGETLRGLLLTSYGFSEVGGRPTRAPPSCSSPPAC